MTLDLAAASDGELAALALAGRQAAYGEIMLRHRAPLLRLIRSHIGGDDDAIDILQDCFVAAFLNLAHYDQTRAMRAWLVRIALNKARDWHRRRHMRQILSMATALTAELAETVPDDAPGSDTVLGDRATLAWTLAAIARLPNRLKEPLILHALEDWSQAAIADLLDISEKAVETRVRRARAKLREMLAARNQ